MTFIQKWLDAVDRKGSILCVNIDPAEPQQRANGVLPAGMSKLDWSLKLVEAVSPYAAAIKPNRQYFKDFSRDEMVQLNQAIHKHGMVSIDDSKIADIGDTNDAALYHAAQEGFDAVTYAPFPGNIAATCEAAKKHGMGLIPLVLMSNPEYAVMKNIPIAGQAFYEYLARESAAHDADGVVVGAPSAKNHLSLEELQRVKELIGPRTVLVPGIGAQGGDLEPIVNTFGDYAIVSVGRAIAYNDDPAATARNYFELIQKLRLS
ncbi:orotidine 5'-phosphate decarboxylase [Pseudobacteriovorax antillogorgiicola]|uniref:Orotidine 5'-phosphate decarboxylase n=1 Tax=Pseudobacteriovorax antillogorgiicola TaxID=1513793 RepID=A0A1Y6B8E4_9BACT|nr:orotidine 5'-phosphate decarboxylase [Pseudobacteriovorax antillogorgiicola]TCS58657.1 orotidine-5'-phosphate decarboxylase [Pseudobacteriovorax antillogorgiicola]SME96265.1 orotidine-5'-phosphate decarboxylase [Pseudobacteriovorax antillogorgiicola]